MREEERKIDCWVLSTVIYQLSSYLHVERIKLVQGSDLWFIKQKALYCAR